jgi:hypothetical protein
MTFPRDPTTEEALTSDLRCNGVHAAQKGGRWHQAAGAGGGLRRCSGHASSAAGRAPGHPSPRAPHATRHSRPGILSKLSLRNPRAKYLNPPQPIRGTLAWHGRTTRRARAPGAALPHGPPGTPQRRPARRLRRRAGRGARRAARGRAAGARRGRRARAAAGAPAWAVPCGGRQGRHDGAHRRGQPHGAGPPRGRCGRRAPRARAPGHGAAIFPGTVGGGGAAAPARGAPGRRLAPPCAAPRRAARPLDAMHWGSQHLGCSRPRVTGAPPPPTPHPGLLHARPDRQGHPHAPVRAGLHIRRGGAPGVSAAGAPGAGPGGILMRGQLRAAGAAPLTLPHRPRCHHPRPAPPPPPPTGGASCLSTWTPVWARSC